MPVALAMIVTDVIIQKVSKLLSFESRRLHMKNLIYRMAYKFTSAWKRKIELGKRRTTVLFYIDWQRDFTRSFQRRTQNFKEPTNEQWSVRLWIVGVKKKKKKLNVLMKMLHHVCLIPFCIIDMNWYDSCKVFFKQLNNLLLSMLPQCVPDLDKKN